MKKTGCCPKCDSMEIIKVPGNFGLHRNMISTDVKDAEAIVVTRYVCMDCGYTEEWIDDPSDRQILNDKFSDVTLDEFG